MRAAPFLTLVFAAAACIAPVPSPAPRSTPATRGEAPDEGAAVGEEVELALGQTVSIRGANATIRFVSVEEDSRCPEGAQCIVAGKARILLEVSERGARPSVVELSTAGESGEASSNGLAIRLIDLTPHPSTKRGTRPEDYRARIAVGKL